MTRQDDSIKCMVRDYRQKQGWSQKELAERIGIKRQAIYDIETGRYLPNTGISLRLARLFGCRVEDLFVDDTPEQQQGVDLVNGTCLPSTRLALSRVRDRLVGLPLSGHDAMPFGLRSADGLLSEDGKHARIFSPSQTLDHNIILMGCDPAFEILSHHVNRLVRDAQVYCRFASSRRSLRGLGEGVAHIAGSHFHNQDQKESNVIAASRDLQQRRTKVIGFSLLEEGLMVAKGNPLGIRSVADLVQPMVRFVNRDCGAALRVLLDDHLQKAGIAGPMINGYLTEVDSHREGAYRIACNVADAALGLRAIAEAFDLGFVPLTAVRCDLLFPEDLIDHPTVKVVLDVMHSSALRKEIDALPGYEASATGKVIAEV
ncbi:substrate-binding domain-containing protein [uncultured Desulfuromonas sp.]|uniref:substrate-binding domain-containing protein n=1 Tax=uncultured Desulfuromonas sp. TaxID=181013 RepID=UPI002AABEB59|nr:substrate-binding domain-containing protein [uncultured Desulfuromonas sp.]